MIFPRHLSKTLLLSETKKFIFIHNYKVGGTSIRAVLSKYQSERYRYLSNLIWYSLPSLRDKTILTMSKHIKYKDVEVVYKEKLNQFRIFGFVRNPWDYEVSKFEYMKQNKKHFQHKLITQMNFEQYIYWRKNNFISQLDFFKSINGEIKCDLFKIEDNKLIDDYLSDLCQEKINLSKENTTIRKKYQSYYKEKHLTDIIENLYKKEIEIFNYSF